MRKKSRTGGRQYASAPQAPPLLQVMPEHRVRIDPSCVGDVCQYLYCVSQRWRKEARRTWSGLRGEERGRRKAQIHAARRILLAADTFILAVTQSIDLRDLDEARRIWREALIAPDAQGDQCQSV